MQTGTRTKCEYGHVISDEVKTVTVPAKLAKNYDVRTITTVCEKHARAAELYEAAQKALAAGDLDAAKAKLEQVAELDADFRSTKSQLDAMGKGSTPNPDTAAAPTVPSSPATPSTQPAPSGTSAPSESLAKWVPGTLSGYRAKTIVTEPNALIREYVPSASGAVLLVIVAEQYNAASAAKTAVETRLERVYQEGSQRVTVNGHAVYLGHNGTSSAVAGFAVGSVFVAVELSGSNPSALVDDVRAVVQQLP